MKKKKLNHQRTKTDKKEDIGLLKGIQEGRTGRFVNIEEFIKKFKK